MSFCSLENQNPNHTSQLNSTNLCIKNTLAPNHVIRTAVVPRSLYNNHQLTPPVAAFNSPKKDVFHDLTALISDEILLRVFSKLREKSHRDSNCLVSKRWFELQGRLVRSVRVLDWDFLISGRMFFRFPNVKCVDLLHGAFVCNSNINSNSSSSSSSTSTSISNSSSGGLNYFILINNEMGTFRVGVDEYLRDGDFDFVLLPVDEVDFGLKVLASVYPSLTRLVVVGCSEIGLLSVGEECVEMEELVLHRCSDNVLVGIAMFFNLRILKLVGVVDGFYRSVVSDRGLIILAQGCKRLVKLELQGCEGGYEGIKAVGECCVMLEELTFCDHRMEDGWLSALCYCESLRTLKFVSCKGIDRDCELDEELGVCPTLERLHLERCQLRDKQSVRALFYVCQTVEEVGFKNCWGLNDAMFLNASLCRRLKSLSIEGCSRLTTQGLEAVVLSWKDLKSLKVISCKNIKDDDVTPMLSALFSELKDFKWCPGNSSFLSARLSSSDMGKRGAKFFKKFQI